MLPRCQRPPWTLMLMCLLLMTTSTTALIAFVPAPAAAHAVLHPHSVAQLRSVHTVTAANSTADGTTLLETGPGYTDTVVNVMSTYNTIGCGCIYDPHPLGVRYNGTYWEIFHEDHAPFTVGTTYNYSAEQAHDGYNDVYTTLTSSSNSVGGATILDDPQLNGNSRASITVTQNWNPAGVCGCVANPRAIGVRYNGNRWAIFNQDGTPIPIGAGFSVLVGDSTTTLPSTSSTYISYISLPSGQSIDNQPNLILLVTPNYNANGTCGCVVDTHPLGVYYDYSLNKWGIYHQDYAPISPGAVYNVLILGPDDYYTDLTGVWRGDDNAYYYVRQIGNVMTWAGFSPDNGVSFTNVFSATRSANSISGSWADVPRGNTLGSGTLAMQINETDVSTVTLHKTGGTGGFGASNWSRVYYPPPPISAAIPPYHLAYQIAHPAEVTGVWSSTQPNDGSVYYVRQVGSQVYWLGVSANNGQFFTNVFVGQRSGNTFSGTWNDVPRGTTTGSGTLALDFIYPDLLWAYGSTGGFGTSQWHRYIPN